jgi:hypothetical protein
MSANGVLLAGPITSQNWRACITISIFIKNDKLASWSGSPTTEQHYAGQNGDDELRFLGVSNSDSRYQGLSAPSVNVFIISLNTAGIVLTNPFQTRAMTLLKTTSASYVGATSVAILGREDSLSTTGLKYGVSLGSCPCSDVVVQLALKVPSGIPWLSQNAV